MEVKVGWVKLIKWELIYGTKDDDRFVGELIL